MKSRAGLVVLMLYTIFSTTYAAVRLPRLISDGMVLQRNAPVTIWGWAEPGEAVTVSFIDSTYQAVADESGEWRVLLPGLAAGGPHRMSVRGENTLHIEHILIGEVWICSGQSNMEISMQRASPLYEREIAEADRPYIRYFEVPKRYNFQEPEADLPGGYWEAPDPEKVLRFSAVAYFFALELYQTYGVPVGLINTSLGESPAEAWISGEGIRQFPEHYDEWQRFRDEALIGQIERADRQRIGQWYRELNEKDRGYQPDGKSWSAPDLTTGDWSTLTVPGYWSDQGVDFDNGVMWFRKEISVPSALAGRPARLLMGRIVDADSVFVNGTFVGSTSYQYPPRRYEVPEGILRAGANVITVRVISNTGKGGFVPDKPYELIIAEQSLSLLGEWKYKAGAPMPPLGPQTFIRWKPVGLYNAMIAPLLHYRMRGVIWYQGESNADRPEEYRTLFPAMIRDWRSRWRQGDFPFLFVQLANFMEARDQPGESNWAAVREAQQLALDLPNTGMAVAIDLGEWNDIHPLNKQDVGRRLALAARRIAYGEPVVHSGPQYRSMKIRGSRVVLRFEHTGSGLVARGGGPLQEFAIAGKDGRFVWAEARIKGDRVIVRSAEVPDPVAVRYAWADNPEGANLYNREGLPAAPFRTDGPGTSIR